MNTAKEHTPQVGKTYRINHSRKGIFAGRIISAGDDWVSVEIVSGQAGAMLPENIAHTGEEITVRLSFATFTELETTS